MKLIDADKLRNMLLDSQHSMVENDESTHWLTDKLLDYIDKQLVVYDIDAVIDAVNNKAEIIKDTYSERTFENGVIVESGCTIYKEMITKDSVIEILKCEGLI